MLGNFIKRLEKQKRDKEELTRMKDKIGLSRKENTCDRCKLVANHLYKMVGNRKLCGLCLVNSIKNNY